MGRITGVTAQPQGATQPTTVLSQIGYQPFGPPNALTYGNGIAESRSFDLDYRMTALADAGKAAIQSLTYGYDAANNVLSITDAVTSGNSQRFRLRCARPAHERQQAAMAVSPIPTTPTATG